MVTLNTTACPASSEETDKTTVEEGDFANIDYEGLKDGVGKLLILIIFWERQI